MKIIIKMGLVLLLIGFLGLIVPVLEAAEIKVKCEKGQSVQSALDSLTGPATIIVTGICTENIAIKKDDVTIQGGTFVGPAPDLSTIRVQAARRVLITGATVRGANVGVWATQGASLTLESSFIEANARNGVGSTYGSTVTVNSCTIRANTLQGVVVTDNSALTLTSSTITDNDAAGVLVQRSSSARIGQSLTGVSGPNTITNNGGSGINVSRSAHAFIDGNTITGNSGNGVNIEGASATVTHNMVANNNKGINVDGSASARIGLNEGGQAAPNTVESNILEGIQSANGGAAFIFANTIRNNGLYTYRPGVAVYRATGRLIGDNTIQGNGGHGVTVNQGTLLQGKGDFNLTPGPDLITQNGYSGIRAWNGSSLDVSNATITGNGHSGISMVLHSTLNVYGSTISSNNWHGIWLEQGSVVNLGSPLVSVTNNLDWGVFCDDMESKLDGNSLGVVNNGNGDVRCKEFQPY